MSQLIASLTHRSRTTSSASTISPKDALVPREPTHILKQLSRRENAKYFVEAIRDNVSTLEDIASRSYRHSNGFDKIVLSPESSERILRMHVWYPGAMEPDLHNHRWSFRSVIVLGTFFHAEYLPDDSGECWSHFKYLPRDGKEYFDLVPHGDVRLRRRVERTLAPGSRYNLSSKQIHYFRMKSDKIGVTFIIQEPAERQITDVFKCVQRDNMPVLRSLVESRSMTVTELDAVLNSVCQALNDNR